MKVLLVVPKLCTPWSEGRKKFALDLLEATKESWQSSLLATYDHGETPFSLEPDREMPLPEASPRPPREPGSPCVDRPPEIEIGSS